MPLLGFLYAFNTAQGGHLVLYPYLLPMFFLFSLILFSSLPLTEISCVAKWKTPQTPSKEHGMYLG